MVMPKDLHGYLKQIQTYLKNNHVRLTEIYRERYGEIPDGYDPFPELTSAINCTQSLMPIKEKIEAFYMSLEPK